MKHQSTSATFGGYQQPTKVNLEIAKLLEEISEFKEKIRGSSDWLRACPAESEDLSTVRGILQMKYTPSDGTPNIHKHKIGVFLKYNFMGEPYLAFTWAGVDPFGEKDE